MPRQSSALILFPHQLFETALETPKQTRIILVEDDLFFKQYRFHVQKLILHRASMADFAARLEKAGHAVSYIQTAAKASMDQLADCLRQHTVTHIGYYDPVDDWLVRRLSTLSEAMKLNVEVYPSPGFLTSRGAIAGYFADHPDRMQHFYEWQRRRLDVLVTDGKPVGGRWSFDKENRKKLPKNISLPKPYRSTENVHVQNAQKWVATAFSDNVGNIDSFAYPVTHTAAQAVLEQFLSERLRLFGPYEDAMASDESQLFHSILSPLLNTGLLTPRQVVTRTLQYANAHDVPIESLEGFIRQIIGWREYMRATYVHYGREMRTGNQLKHTTPLAKSWWDGSTGLVPLDQTIKRILDTAYAHHIERLMVCGNAMVLLRINPDDAYVWFMEMFIDAYDWVMVPNVYAMSQFSAGNKITTKPYISGSNYIIKMSDYTKGDWSEHWDALYWRFIADNRELFTANPRASMMVSLYDRLSDEKRQSIQMISDQWLKPI